jgi:hypothetical protein
VLKLDTHTGRIWVNTVSKKFGNYLKIIQQTSGERTSNTDPF